MPLDDNDDDNGNVDDDDDDDDEDHSLATPETNYWWDTSDCDLEHSRFALDGVKHAGPITFHRSFPLVSSVSLAAPGSATCVYHLGPPRKTRRDTSARADTPPRARACERNTTRECISRSSGLENVVTQ